MTFQKLSDSDRMPIGEAHRGKRMCNVPARHLLWLAKTLEPKFPNCMAVIDYVERNREALEREVGERPKGVRRG